MRAGVRLLGLALALAAMPGRAQEGPQAALEALERQIQTDAAGAERTLARLLAQQPPPDVALRARYGQAQLAAARGEQPVVPVLPIAPAADAELAQACVRARFEWQHGSLTRAAALLTGSLALEDTGAPAWLQVDCRMLLAQIQGDRGATAPALAQWRLAQQQADAAGQPAWRRALARAGLARQLPAVDDAALALHLSDEAVALARQGGDAAVLARVVGARAALAGAALPAQGLLWQQALALAQQGGSSDLAIEALSELAAQRLAAGDPAQAASRARAALALAAQTPPWPRTLRRASQQLGLAVVALGSMDEGLALVRPAIAAWQQAEAHAHAADALLALGLALAQAGQPGAAYDAWVDRRALRDAMVSEDREQAVAELHARLQADALRQQQLALQADLALRAEQERAHGMRARIGQVGTAVLVLGLPMAGLAWRRARGRMRADAQAHAALQAVVAQDALTGLATRAAAQSWMQARGPRLQGALFVLDVDRFKAINDTLGHAAGDTVLQGLAERLRAAVRGGDLLARWGGEEFLLLTAQADEAQAQALAARLLDGASRPPLTVAGQPLRATVSIGYLVGQGAAAPRWEAALAAADAALYGAKLLGRHRAVGVRRLLPMVADAQAAEAACARGDWRCEPGLAP